MMMTPQEVAQEVGCTQENIQHHIRVGNIHAVKTEGGKYFIDRAFLSSIKHIVKQSKKAKAK